MDFGEAEARYSELQRDLRRKAISQETFHQEVAKLMVQDREGKYWAVDPDGGRWLYHDGQNWIPALPPTMHTQVNRVVARRKGRGWVILGVGGIVLLCLLAVLLAWVYRSRQLSRSIAPGGPSIATPAAGVQASFTIVIETPSPVVSPAIPTASGKPIAPIVLPTESSACRPDAAFVSHVNMPDGQTVKANQRFDKIWRVRNTGTCPWIGFNWTYITGDHLGGPDSVSVSRTEPGDTADIKVPLYAEADPGTYDGTWRLRDAQQPDVGPEVHVRVVVAGTPDATP
jgi:hypothetical protein